MCVCVCVHVCVHVYVCMCECVCVRAHVCGRVWVFKHPTCLTPIMVSMNLEVDRIHESKRERIVR